MTAHKVTIHNALTGEDHVLTVDVTDDQPAGETALGVFFGSLSVVSDERVDPLVPVQGSQVVSLGNCPECGELMAGVAREPDGMITLDDHLDETATPPGKCRGSGRTIVGNATLPPGRNIAGDDTQVIA
jgi:hypothetical protein